MPFVNVKTNAAVSGAQKEAIKERLGQAITAIPGKSESWLMVGIEERYALWFQGTDAPAAIAEVSLYGNAAAAALDAFTGSVTELLSDTLSIPKERIYVSYMTTPHWGWNGNNF